MPLRGVRPSGVPPGDVPLRGFRRMEALAAGPPPRKHWRIRLAILASVLIHVMIGVLLFVTIRGHENTELLPPPSAVTMLFESGRKSGPTLPNPDLQASPAPPSPVVPLPAPPLPPVEKALPPPPASPPSPAPEPRAEAPPVEAAPPPPPPATEPVPLPPPPPARPAPRPVTPPSPPKQAVAPKAPAFPAPMNFSFGRPLSIPSQAPARTASRHIPGTIDMSLGPASQGTADSTPLSEHDEDMAGADWRNALSRWVAEHAYYPDQARREGDEGDAKVHVLASRDGRVKEVELIGKSGSVWLDMALVALFRDQHIPPLPSGMDGPIDFDFTMHYILIRR